MLTLYSRGKRFYRHFPKPANTDSDELDELAVEGREKANFTPARLLWPKKEAKRDDDAIADEEAATDVEDDVVEAELDIPSTPVRKGKQPNHKHLASPPTTQRTTRSMDKLGGAPAGGSQRAQLSLSKWGSVAKSSHKSSVTSVKRSGEPLTPDGAKKSRSHS